MEKVGEVTRRGSTTRLFSPQKRQLNNKNQQSRLNNGGGVVDMSERSKNDKFAGGGGSDDEEENEEHCSSLLPLTTGLGSSSKRVKLLHSKPLSDCNGVDHAAIPRKLRSAMSKRSRESLSPPLPDAKKHHHRPYTNGTNSFQMNTAKKSKQKMKQGGISHQSLGQGTSSQITKDEEEVVQTLYALATMSPNNKYDETRVDQPISEAKSCPLPETTETPVLASEVLEEVGTRTIRSEATNLSAGVSKELVRYELKDNSLTESTVLDRATISVNQKSGLGTYSSITPPDPRGSSLLFNTAHTDDIPMGFAARSPVLSEHGMSNRSTQAKQHEASFSERKPELLAVAVDVIEQERQLSIKNEGSDASVACIEGTVALWPRLSMAVSGGGGEVPRSSATKAPICPDGTASGAKPTSKEEVNPVRKRLLKKCATHVNLSHFILVNQASGKKPMFSVASDQLKPNEGTKLGATEAKSLNKLNNGFNGLDPLVSTIDNTGKSMNEARTGIDKDKRLQEDRQQPSLNLTLEKQTCDFLSLSVPNGCMEPINDIKQEKNGLESSAQIPVSYLHPIVQNVQLMPFPYHGHSPSSAYPDQLTVAAQQLQFQLPQHMSDGPFYGQHHLIQAGAAKQHQQIWAAQYMPGGNPSIHLSKWQHGSSQRDSPLLISGTEPLLTSSSLLPEVFSAKFPTGQQHQQQLFAVPSQSHNYKGKRQQQPQPQNYRHFSGVYENGPGGLHSESRSNHLQLVCNAEKL